MSRFLLEARITAQGCLMPLAFWKAQIIQVTSIANTCMAMTICQTLLLTGIKSLVLTTPFLVLLPFYRWERCLRSHSQWKWSSWSVHKVPPTNTQYVFKMKSIKTLPFSPRLVGYSTNQKKYFTDSHRSWVDA